MPDATTLHQTWETQKLPLQLYLWHVQWDIAGLETTITDDAQRIIDVARLGDEKYVKAFEVLQRMGVPSCVADFWRYAKIYLDGGVYADIDVTPSEEFSKNFTNGTSMVIVEETMRLGILGHAAVFLGLTDIRRYPQYSAAFLAASPGHPILRYALDLCVENIQHPTFPLDKEPIASLELCGPPVLTDAVRIYLSEKPQEDTIRIIPRKQARGILFEHHNLGSWKHYTSKEVTILSYVLVIAVLGFAVRWNSRSQWKQRIFRFVKSRYDPPLPS